ncbi:MAG TPA: class I SAM-dependent methyltransferase, partial [Opitutaceae bacterium]|nr:class I SAM-dependent methyltransferase [Opitutaceae bacterium]
DFTEPEKGWKKWRARLWLVTMYFFFRWSTRLATRTIPQAEKILLDEGFKRAADLTMQHGFIRSAVFRR